MEEEQKQNTQQAKEEHAAPSPKHMSIRSILGGDILANDFFKRQTRLLILIMILTVLYIDNRYSSQQELIKIDKLKKSERDNALRRIITDLKLSGDDIIIPFSAVSGEGTDMFWDYIHTIVLGENEE